MMCGKWWRWLWCGFFAMLKSSEMAVLLWWLYLPWGSEGPGDLVVLFLILLWRLSRGRGNVIYMELKCGEESCSVQI